MDMHRPPPRPDDADLAHQLDDFLADYNSSARCDANLERLRSEDPDAARIFAGISFTGWLTERGQTGPLGRALEEYGAAKSAQGRMDLFHALLSGVDELMTG
ncbi:hypothetical protein [Nocardia carnea]|uniref:hypothetical protein n=1 Tax=Nocardia carnea TaxID=37328 RepID=UPI0024581DBF|nr:hypothetical protein [Nocardia carnea]